jgi:hypothetical protein
MTRDIHMKVLALTILLAFPAIAIGVHGACAARPGAMSGSDNTYRSTSKCTGGTCKVKPHSRSGKTR